MEPGQEARPANRDMISRVGPLDIDWPRSIGYFGGIAIAVAYDLIPPPLAIFLAAIPLVKLLEQPRGPWPVRMVADMLEGAAKPVGGDAEATVRLAQDSPAKAQRRQHPRQGRPPTLPKTPRTRRPRPARGTA